MKNVGKVINSILISLSCQIKKHDEIELLFYNKIQKYIKDNFDIELHWGGFSFAERKVIFQVNCEFLVAMVCRNIKIKSFIQESIVSLGAYKLCFVCK